MIPFAVVVLLGMPLAVPSADAPPTDSQGDMLPPGAVARIGTTRFRHGGTISSLTFSPDGKRLVSTDGHSIGVWEAGSGRCLAFRMLPPQYTIWSPIVSPDGTSIACRLDNENLGVQDIESGKVRCDLGRKDSRIYSLAFSNDNRWLVAAEQDGTVLLWNVRADKLSQKWKTAPADTFDSFYHAFTPDGAAVAQARSTGIRLWDVQSGKELWHVEPRKEKGLLRGLTLSPDGQLLVTLNDRGRLDLFEVKSGTFLREIVPQPNDLVPVFSPDGNQLLTSRDSGEICFWDVETAKISRELKGAPEANPASLALSPDGKYLASGGHDHAIHLWDLKTEKELFPTKNDLGGAVSARFLSDGKTLLAHCTYDTQRYSGIVNGRLGFWDIKGEALRHATFDPKDAHRLAISPDARIIALAVGPNFGGPMFRPIPNKGLRSSIRVCDRDTGKELVKLKDLPCQIDALGFSPNGRYLFSSAFNAGPNDEDYHTFDVVYVWKRAAADALDKVAELPVAERQTRFFCAPDSKWLGVSAQAGWDFYYCETGKLFRSCPDVAGNVRAASASGRVLVFASDKRRTAALVELATGNTICKLECEPRYLNRAHFAISPDGCTVAGDLNSETIVLWDTATGKQIGKLQGHRGDICSLEFSTDGRFLISGSEDTTILIWDYRTQLPKRAKTADLSAKRLDELWQDLQASDPRRGYRAVAVLVQAPGQALPLLKEKVRAATATDDERYRARVKELDDDQFEVRERASAELSKAGALAESALRRTLDQEVSPETKRRVTALLGKLPASQPPRELLGALRGLEVLERIGTAAARESVDQLGKGPIESPLTREAKESLERMKQRRTDGEQGPPK